MTFLSLLNIFQPITPGVMERWNQHHGRAQGSTIDMETYCPPEVKRAMGPLFGDIDGIKERYDAWMSLSCRAL